MVGAIWSHFRERKTGFPGGVNSPKVTEILECRCYTKLVWLLEHSEPLCYTSLPWKEKHSSSSSPSGSRTFVQTSEKYTHLCLDPLCLNSRSLGMPPVPHAPVSAPLLLLLLAHLHFYHQEWLSSVFICPYSSLPHGPLQPPALHWQSLLTVNSSSCNSHSLYGWRAQICKTFFKMYFPRL